MRNSSAETPDLLEIALDKTDYKPADIMNIAVTARSAGRLTLNVFTDRLVASQSEDVKAGTAQLKMVVGRDWGTGAYMVATLRRPLDAPAQRMPGRAIGVQWFGIDRAAHTLTLDMTMPATMRPNSTLAHSGACRRPRAERGRAHRGGRRRCRHSQSHQLQAAGAGRLLSRPAPAHRRDPRPLRAIDRRHAGRARRDPLRRRYRAGRTDRLAADASRRSRFIPASSPSVPTAWRR